MLDRTTDMLAEARLRIPIYENQGPGTEDQQEQRKAASTHAIAVKGAFQELACLVMQACGQTREAALALKDLETSSMWAVKSLHAHGPAERPTQEGQ